MKNEWIKSKERLPEQDQFIKMLIPDYHEISFGIFDFEGGFNDGIGYLCDGLVVGWKPAKKESE